MGSVTPPNHRYNYKCLFFLVTIYISCFPLIQIGLHKPLVIGYLHLSAGSLIFPITFVISDIIAETYGFQIARQLILAHIPATIFYFAMLNFILHVSSTPNWTHQVDYNYIFQDSSLVGVLGNLGVVIGFMINVYAISKWKILIKGKYFWLRSIGASSIGELIQLIFGAIAALYIGLWQKNEWANIFISIYLTRLFLAALLSFPANLLVWFLKKIENVDINDNGINFNPFKIAVKS